MGVFCARGGSPSMSPVSPDGAGLFLAHGGGQHFHVRYLGHVGWRGAMIGNMGSAVGSDAGAGGVRSTSLMAC